MNQLNCDIIKDLMPSYLDNLCSDSSRKAVEDHLQECASCRAILETLRSTNLVSAKAETKQLDFMKKVRQHYTRQSTAKVLLLFTLTLLILVLNTCFFWKSTQKIILYYYILFPVLSLGTWFLLSDSREKPKQDPLRTVCGLISVLGILCGLFLEYFLCRALASSSDSVLVFGLKLHQTGPWCNTILISIAAIELVVFAVLSTDALRKGHSLGILPTLSLSGCILCLTFRLLLFFMSEHNNMQLYILSINRIVLLETSAILLVEYLAGKFRKRHLQTDSPGSL